MDTSRILELAATISESTTAIHKALAARALPLPSFDVGTPKTLLEETQDARDAVLDATAELHDLLLGPLNLLYRHSGHNNTVCLQAIHRFNIAKSFGVDEEVSFAHIAKRCSLNEKIVRRLLRHAITMHIFTEPSEGMVRHTSASVLLREPHVHSWMGVGSNEMWPAAVRVVDALTKWPDSEEPNETAFALSNGVEASAYDIIGRDPDRAMQFGEAMKAYTLAEGFEASHILDNYDWAAIGSGLVVDVGGGRGHIATALAHRYKDLDIIVQDMGKVVEGAENEVPIEVRQRVRFMPHNFLAQQTVEADVYYFRWVFHNWPDKYAEQVLCCLVPVLKHGSRILINDVCMPQPGQGAHWKEKDLRSNDLNMLAIFNSYERDAKEWDSLFRQADERFEFLGVIEPKGSALAIIEARWNSTRGLAG